MSIGYALEKHHARFGDQLFCEHLVDGTARSIIKPKTGDKLINLNVCILGNSNSRDATRFALEHNPVVESLYLTGGVAALHALINHSSEGGNIFYNLQSIPLLIFIMTPGVLVDIYPGIKNNLPHAIVRDNSYEAMTDIMSWASKH